MALTPSSQLSPGHLTFGDEFDLPSTQTLTPVITLACAKLQLLNESVSMPYRGGVMCGHKGQFYCILRSLTHARPEDLPGILPS